MTGSNSSDYGKLWICHSWSKGFQSLGKVVGAMMNWCLEVGESIHTQRVRWDLNWGRWYKQPLKKIGSEWHHWFWMRMPSAYEEGDVQEYGLLTTSRASINSVALGGRFHLSECVFSSKTHSFIQQESYFLLFRISSWNFQVKRIREKTCGKHSAI
jgi:hypothetical protein